MDDRFSYDDDFLVWTERQALALRALAKSRSDLPNDLDLEHVAEEIEDMGRSELSAARSHIRNIMTHLIKASCDPDAQAVGHWAGEARAFHRSFGDRFTPSMRSRLDLPKLWREAREDALEDLALFGKSADRKSTRLNSSHIPLSRMPSSA